MDDPKEILRQQILEQFGDQLRDIDANVEIIVNKPLPSEKELSKKNLCVSYLGGLKEKTVWVLKKGGIIVMIFVTIAQIPDAIDVYKNVYIPKTKEVGLTLIKALDEGNFFDIDDEDTINACPNEGIVIVNRKLITSLEETEDEIEKQKDPLNYYMQAGSEILPVSSSGMTYNINPDLFKEIV